MPKSETPSLANAKVTKESETGNRQNLKFDGERSSSEVVNKIEVLDNESPSTSNGTVAKKKSSLRIANLIKDLEKNYDSGKKILEESRMTDAEESSRSALEGRRARAEELSGRFGVGVEVVSSLEEFRESEFYKGLSRSERRALERRKGAYDPRTGRVIVLAHNHRDADDVSETVFHEVVAHKGLREPS